MAVSETLKRPITGEALFQMGDVGRCELVRGEIVRMSPAGGRHGKIANWVATLLTLHVRAEKLGVVYAAETGFYTQRHPDSVRAPDAMFVSNERVAQIGDPAKYLDVAPDLAVEILSPDDTWDQAEAKAGEYLRAGVRLVWIVSPEHRTVSIYRPSSEQVLLNLDDMLTGEDVLPGFAVPVSEIFE